MNIGPYFAEQFRILDKAMQGKLDGTKIAGISDTISNYAIASAIASAAAALLPGGAGVAAALTQTGIVWATYVKINKTIGLSMSKETVKFLGHAIATNIITQFGVVLAGHVVASIISLIPIAGSALAATAEAAMGYCLIYAAAYVYVKLLSWVLRPDGSLDIQDKDKTSEIIKKLMDKKEMKGVIDEGRKRYKADLKSGAIDAAMKKKHCKECGTEYEDGDHFCSLCGHDHTKDR